MMRPILVILFVLSLFNVTGQTEARKKQFNLSKGLALQGYDPVSYFDGEPQEGKEELRVTHRGVIYQFATKANLNKFKSAPDKYEPAYGGWCAYAMGETGEKVKVDPETYKILEGKLYLFYNFWGNNTLREWNKDEKRLKGAGDQHWKKIVP
ncbi:MAG: YHS domain-containing (seleno)protein [Cyclobacteriaceae bacterium]